ncbi:MAG: pyruvate formate lyase family protein [Desulfobacterium sp.]
MLSTRLTQLKTQLLDAHPQVYAERALLVTQAYQETQGSEPSVQRAHAMEKIFLNSSVVIRKDELVVGAKTPTPLGSPLYPEFNCQWIEKEIDTLAQRKETAFFISEDTRKSVKEQVIPYWSGRTVYDRIVENVPPQSLEAVDEGLFFHYYLNRSIGHITVGYGQVLNLGLSGIKKQVESALEKQQDNVYLHSLIKVISAISAFARRYADEAEKLAKSCTDEIRSEELYKIAEICNRVPLHPANSFREAIQSFWFFHLALNLESNSYAISPGRFDQYIYPFYQRDLALGEVSPKEAQELINCLWIKFAELTVVKEGGTAKASNTYADFQNLNIGGLKKDGTDGINDISYMCIEAQSELCLPQPQLSCLISTRSPREFLIKSCELARKGTGMPAFFNADELVLSLMDKGKSLEDARCGGINGCVEITGQGNDNMASSGYVNLVKCLELTLNNGKSMTTGRQWGPETGAVDALDSMEKIWAAFETQIRHQVELKHSYDQGAKAAFSSTCPVLCTSLAVQGCIESAKDFHDGGAHYNLPMMCGVGMGTVVDSLGAIDCFVFRKKAMPLSRITKGMQDNFKTDETLRHLLLKKGPKFGNDKDEVDDHATRLISTFVKILKEFKNSQNIPYAANMIPTTTHLPFGELTAASADGRLVEMPMAEGISPVQGMDLSGPTAVVKTMGKLDHGATAGTLLNMKFTPKTLEGVDDLNKFADLIRAYFDMGGHHMQFNVVDHKTLLEAQEKPEEFRSLLVRVAGYSDYFVWLSKDVQNEVISRTAHEA